MDKLITSIRKIKNNIPSLLLAISLVFFLSSCQRHSNMQTEGVPFLQGVWVQDSIPYQDQMMEYALHQFTFTCDSIYAVMDVFAKNKIIPDSCYKNGNWQEYARGVYVLRGDSIIVEGIYTRANGRQKISGCYRYGQYTPKFRLAYQSDDSVVLENRFDAKPIILRKVKDIECVPKKRWEM